MKVGRERTPLAERLNEGLNKDMNTDLNEREKAMEEARVELRKIGQAADLMEAAWKSFEDDCRKSLSDVRTIIENDMVELVTTSETLKSSVKPIWATAVTAGVVVVLLSLIASWYWASTLINRAQNASFWQMGLTLHQTKSGQFLTWDNKKIELITCQSGSEPKPCLKLSEGD